MSTRILLVNFSQEETNKLRDMPITIERGYFSDVKEIYVKKYPKDENKEIRYYFPYSIFEYNVIAFNLNSNKDLASEFESEAVVYSKDKCEDFVHYLEQKKILVFLLGNYELPNLSLFGVPAVELKSINDKYRDCNFVLKEDDCLYSIFNELWSHVLMPPQKCIAIGTEYYSQYPRMNTIYTDKGDARIGCYYKGIYFNDNHLRFIVLPMFKNNVLAVSKILKAIAKLDKKILPEIYEPDWVDSDDYYPAEVYRYEQESLAKIIEMQASIKELKLKTNEVKSKYKYLRDILCKSGEELKSSIVGVLNNIFMLKTIDSDEGKKGNLLDEDVLIEYNGRAILVEIKGTNSENPSPTFIGQVWKHIAKYKSKIAEGALILNYDISTNPKERSIAYKGEHEKELEEIIFIDTRVMFELSLAVIDMRMPVEEALKVLFGKGRVLFSYEAYAKSLQQSSSDEK